MQSKQPTCTINKPNIAKIFCCTASCQEPAFGCSLECVDHSHSQNQQLKMWKNFRSIIMPLINRNISEEHSRVLQRQGKDLTELLSYIEKLRCENEFAIVKLQAELRMSEEVERVLTLIRTDNTDKVTGGDMCRLISSIKDKELYVNGAEVDRKIQQRLENVDKAIIDVRETLKQLEFLEDKSIEKYSVIFYMKEKSQIEQESFSIEHQLKKTIQQKNKQQISLKFKESNKMLDKQQQLNKIKEMQKDFSVEEINKLQVGIASSLEFEKQITGDNKAMIEIIKNIKSQLQSTLQINKELNQKIDLLIEKQQRLVTRNTLSDMQIGLELLQLFKTVMKTQKQEKIKKLKQIMKLKDKKIQRLRVLNNLLGENKKQTE